MNAGSAGNAVRPFPGASVLFTEARTMGRGLLAAAVLVATASVARADYVIIIANVGQSKPDQGAGGAAGAAGQIGFPGQAGAMGGPPAGGAMGGPPAGG